MTGDLPPLPLLGRGRHRHPSQGACFMEYTALLAGEAFSDHPACVDEELAAVLRGANDLLSEEARASLLPLLGRSIGLTVPPPSPVPASLRSREARRRRREEAARHVVRAARLRAVVRHRFLTEVGAPSRPSAWPQRLYRDQVACAFWDVMDHPAPVRTSEEYVRRLLDHLDLLHRCYEQAMEQLGIVPAGTRAEPPASAEPLPDSPLPAPHPVPARAGAASPPA